MRFAKINVAAVMALIIPAQAGPAAYGICQAGCAALVTVCYAGQGVIWGAVLPPAIPVAILACNAAFGTCQAACWAALIAPTP